MGSSNGTYVNGVKLQPKIFCPLNSGDTISLGQGEKVTFMFRVNLQNAANAHAATSTNNTAPTLITSAAAAAATATEAEIPITLITKLLGLVMMIGGLCFLAANIAIGGFLNAPLIIPSIIGILILIYGGQIRILGWVLIAVGVALAIGTGTIILAPISLLTFLITASCCSAGYQLFTDGKILDFNPLALKAVMRGRR